MQCREKWCSLDPTVNSAPYSVEEDERLMTIVEAVKDLLGISQTSTNTSSSSSGIELC